MPAADRSRELTFRPDDLTVREMQQALFTWGIPVGKVRGIQVTISWLLVILAVFRFDQVMGAFGGDRRSALTCFIVYELALFGSIFLHEMGHAMTAIRVGGRASEIILWPLGGLAVCEAPSRWRPQLLVAAGGPLVNLALLALTWVAFLWMPIPDGLAGLALTQLERELYRVNGLLLVLNLLPLYPLDGGRIFHSAVWGFFTWRQPFGAYGRSNRVTIWAGRVTAVLGIIAAFAAPKELLPFSRFFLVFVFAWGWYVTEGLRR